MRSTRLASLLALVALTLLAACKDAARSSTSAAAPADSARTQAPTAQPIPEGPIQATCVPVKPDMVDLINIGIKGAGARQAIAVLSHAFSIQDPKSRLYYISGTVTSGAGGVPYVMTWATQSLEVGRGIVFAVTPGARAVTIFPDSLPAVHPDNTSGAAVASRQCVMKATGVTKGL